MGLSAAASGRCGVKGLGGAGSDGAGPRSAASGALGSAGGPARLAEGGGGDGLGPGRICRGRKGSWACAGGHRARRGAAGVPV